jgi:anti-sigma factor RsiW
MSAEPNLTDQDYELLSAYIDGMLTDGERIALESRLQHETTLRR